MCLLTSFDQLLAHLVQIPSVSWEKSSLPLWALMFSCAKWGRYVRHVTCFRQRCGWGGARFPHTYSHFLSLYPGTNSERKHVAWGHLVSLSWFISLFKSRKDSERQLIKSHSIKLQLNFRSGWTDGTVDIKELPNNHYYFNVVMTLLCLKIFKNIPFKDTHWNSRRWHDVIWFTMTQWRETRQTGVEIKEDGPGAQCWSWDIGMWGFPILLVSLLLQMFKAFYNKFFKKGQSGQGIR